MSRNESASVLRIVYFPLRGNGVAGPLEEDVLSFDDTGSVVVDVILAKCGHLRFVRKRDLLGFERTSGILQ